MAQLRATTIQQEREEFSIQHCNMQLAFAVGVEKCNDCEELLDQSQNEKWDFVNTKKSGSKEGIARSGVRQQTTVGV